MVLGENSNIAFPIGTISRMLTTGMRQVGLAAARCCQDCAACKQGEYTASTTATRRQQRAQVQGQGQGQGQVQGQVQAQAVKAQGRPQARAARTRCRRSSNLGRGVAAASRQLGA